MTVFRIKNKLKYFDFIKAKSVEKTKFTTGEKFSKYHLALQDYIHIVQIFYDYLIKYRNMQNQNIGKIIYEYQIFLKEDWQNKISQKF
ncbi:unnamed protein product [Paramecium octaurelia]|uniref:Uncharacterized protein n=1 Tax=Paramecium octaurelia TaxID=43137 RepID=A0A8S1VHZ2_PAROT|nr:unnamed protein product [Paramecium octaurelia]